MSTVKHSAQTGRAPRKSKPASPTNQEENPPNDSPIVSDIGKTPRYLAGRCGFCMSQLVTTSIQGTDPQHLDSTPYGMCSSALREKAKRSQSMTALLPKAAE